MTLLHPEGGIMAKPLACLPNLCFLKNFINLCLLGLGYIETCGWHQMSFEISFMPLIGKQKKGKKEFQWDA